MSFVLNAVSDEICTPRALKILAAAALSSAPLRIKTISSISDELFTAGLQFPLGMAGQHIPIRMVIILPDSKTAITGSSSYIMKTFLSFTPISGIYRMSNFDLAQVDSWVSFATTHIEIPVDAFRKTITASGAAGADINDQVIQSIKADVNFALAVINSHVMYSTYIVGEHVSAADIALVCALYDAANAKLWDPTNTIGDVVDENICRWYKTILHQGFFQKALDQLSSISEHR